MTAQVAESSLTIYNYKELFKICVDSLYHGYCMEALYSQAISDNQFIIDTYMYIDIPSINERTCMLNSIKIHMVIRICNTYKKLVTAHFVRDCTLE